MEWAARAAAPSVCQWRQRVGSVLRACMITPRHPLKSGQLRITMARRLPVTHFSEAYLDNELDCVSGHRFQDGGEVGRGGEVGGKVSNPPDKTPVASFESFTWRSHLAM